MRFVLKKQVAVSNLTSLAQWAAVIAALLTVQDGQSRAQNFDEFVASGPTVSTDHDQLVGELNGVDAGVFTSQPFDPAAADGCEHCQSGTWGWGRGRCDACDPPYGMVNRLIDNKHACWTFRADALLLWRESPPARELGELVPVTGLPNAQDLDSPGAAGPRFSIFRTDGCGDAVDATYFRVANWRAVNIGSDGGTGIFTSNLGAAAQSFELNGRTTLHPIFQLLGGFRWFQWEENLFVTYAPGPGPLVTDSLYAGTINDMYGYQIGFDTLLLNTGWMRVEGLMKGGAYYNRIGLATTSGVTGAPFQGTYGADSAAFVGELGMTGVMPLTQNIDFRFGYLALWLQGIAQPTNQFKSGPVSPGTPVVVDTTGSTVLQGVSLGLEGRW
jgi:hypothetical protein